MILCDTGFIVGLIRASDRFHQRCTETMKTTREQLITT
jgi:predicted nucleic acid-binding protein